MAERSEDTGVTDNGTTIPNWQQTALFAIYGEAQAMACLRVASTMEAVYNRGKAFGYAEGYRDGLQNTQPPEDHKKLN